MQKIVENILPLLNSNKVHIAFVSASYLPIFNIWFAYLKKISINDLCIVALDADSYKLLTRRNIPCVLMKVPEEITPNNKSKLWVKRLELIKKLIDNNIDVTHSDADAFWLKDISGFLDQEDADLIFSIAYGIPKDVVKLWGFILCCGFFRIKSNARTKKFMRDFLEKCQEQNDDQRALNRLLLEKNTIWKEDSVVFNSGYCEVYDLTIYVIPKSKVSRIPAKNLCVYHPFLSSVNIDEKVQQVDNGLYKCGVGSNSIERWCKKILLRVKQHMR